MLYIPKVVIIRKQIVALNTQWDRDSAPCFRYCLQFSRGFGGRCELGNPTVNVRSGCTVTFKRLFGDWFPPERFSVLCQVSLWPHGMRWSISVCVIREVSRLYFHTYFLRLHIWLKGKWHTVHCPLLLWAESRNCLRTAVPKDRAFFLPFPIVPTALTDKRPLASPEEICLERAKAWNSDRARFL